MGYQQHPGDLWEGLEPVPEPPQQNNNRTILLIGGAVALLFALGICLLAGYLLLRARTGGGSTPEPTTVVEIPPVTLPPEAASPTVALTPLPDQPTATVAPLATDTPAPEAPLPTETIQVSGFAVRRFSSPPVINASLEEWAGFESIQSQFQVFSANSWDGSDDLEAFWQVGWDNDALYIAVRVEDETHVQNQTGNQIFKGDSVDMQIDTNILAGARRVNSRTFQITFSPGDFGSLPPSYYLFRANDAGSFIADPAQGNIQLASALVAGGYVVEARIPWATLEMTPAPGTVLGISLNASDNDVTGEAIQEVMKSHVITRTLLDPSTWGRMTLADS